MSTNSAKTDLPEDPWESVTWEGSERLQLRRERAMTLREKILAMEGMAEVAQRFARMRADGNPQK
jgi:hypothetical protein